MKRLNGRDDERGDSCSRVMTPTTPFVAHRSTTADSPGETAGLTGDAPVRGLVRPAVVLVGLSRWVTNAPRPFHRPPLDDPATPPPTRESLPDEPVAPARPPFAVSATSAVTGVVLAGVLRQPMLALFGLVTSLSAAVSWAAGNLGHRRRHRRWRRVVDDIETRHSAALDSWRLREVARDVRSNPPWGRLLEVVGGSGRLWSRRGDHADAWSVAIDVDRRVDVGPGRVLGVHGEAADVLARAIVARSVVNVGPADLVVVPVGDAGIPAWPQVRAARPPRGESDKHALVVGAARELSSRSVPWRAACAKGRAAVLMTARRREELSADCDVIIDADAPCAKDWSLERFAAVEPVLVEHMSRWIDPDDRASLPSRVGWIDRGSGRPMRLDPETIRESWCSSVSGLSAVVGVTDAGMTSVDLVRDGPHAVVVGTTGSGKSGFLRSLVIGLAVANPPERLNMVLVDFKGGAAFDDLVELPHVLGVLTDLDGDDDGSPVERFLDGLRFELRRRERTLRELGVADISQLPTANAARSRLVIVVDEAAAVRERHTGFVEALVAIAQRGRSLGVHLVLGSQRAAGVFSADVMANCNLRVALRLQSSSDSIEVLGSAVAATLPDDVPGRAFVAIGGGTCEAIQMFDLADDAPTVVTAIVGAAAGWRRPPRPWLDALPDRVSWSDRAVGSVGVVADLENCAHLPLRTERRSVALIGARGSGRSSALAAVAAAWCENGGSEVVVLSAGGDDERNLWESLLGTRGGASVVARPEDRESVHRFVRAVSSPTWDGLVVVDGIDTWRSASFGGRCDAHLWDDFEIAARRLRGASTAVSALDESGVPSSLRSDGTTWRLLDPRSPGRIVDHAGRSGRFAMPEAGTITAAVPLPRLPGDWKHPDPTVFGLGGLALEPMRVDWRRIMNGLLVVGGPGTGRSTAVDRLAAACRAVTGREPLVVDDAEAESMAPTTGDGPRRITLAVVSPGFLRARLDHWTQALRRGRTGLLLGSAGSEPDLLGAFGGPAERLPSMFADVPGRGLWVVDGVAVDVVQVAR